MIAFPQLINMLLWYGVISVHSVSAHFRLSPSNLSHFITLPLGKECWRQLVASWHLPLLPFHRGQPHYIITPPMRSCMIARMLSSSSANM